MSKPLFEYDQYRPYLIELIEEKGRGEKSKLAHAMNCHLAHLSRVLSGKDDLSLEQADACNTYLSHNGEESDYFLLLVSHARAGTVSLRETYAKKIRKISRDRLTVEGRLKLKKFLPADQQAIYYSEWYYSAIHLLISIPEFQSKEKILSYLRISQVHLHRALDFLVSTGLAEFENGRYKTGKVALHLQNDSPWVSRHHSNWRLQTIQSLYRLNPENFHYTSVISMAEKDSPRIKKIMVEAIEKIRGIVKDSPEEKPFCYTLDFFGIA